MKTALAIILATALIFLGKNVLSQGLLIETEGFGENPGGLRMFSYQPKSELKDFPLVVILPGCTQSAEDVIHHSGWIKLADSLGLILLCPQTNYLNNISRCFNWFKKEHISGRSGESASIRNMIEYLVYNNAISSSQIFITGLSAGGAMAVAMLVQYPETFAAGAIFAGGAYIIANNGYEANKAMQGKINKTPTEWGDLVRGQNPDYTGSYPRISIFHGERDKTVDPLNASQLVAQWKDIHGIKEAANYTLIYSGIKLEEWFNTSGTSVVKLYLFEDLGHAVPINPGVAINQGGEVGKYFKDIDFHSPWQCAIDFGLVKE